VEGRSPGSGTLAQESRVREIGMRLTTPPAIRRLQRKLYVKAKAEPTYRFYSLYDKVYRTDILAYAYALAKANGGAPGVEDKRSSTSSRPGWRAG
jgi:RNA-directed DNA polymerase